MELVLNTKWDTGSFNKETGKGVLLVNVLGFENFQLLNKPNGWEIDFINDDGVTYTYPCKTNEGVLYFIKIS